MADGGCEPRSPCLTEKMRGEVGIRNVDASRIANSALSHRLITSNLEPVRHVMFTGGYLYVLLVCIVLHVFVTPVCL